MQGFSIIRFVESTDCAEENSQDLETRRKSGGITLTRAGPYRLRDFGQALWQHGAVLATRDGASVGFRCTQAQLNECVLDSAHRHCSDSRYIRWPGQNLRPTCGMSQRQSHWALFLETSW